MQHASINQSGTIETMPTVGINAHLLSGQPGYRQAGIHTYISQVLNHLPGSADLRYRVFTHDGAARHLKAGLETRVSLLGTSNPVARIAWEQSVYPMAARFGGVDLLHSMAFVTPLFNRLPSIVTVYDLSPIHYPERFTTLKRLYLQTQTRRSVRSATRVVAIAEAGKQDIHDVFGVPLDKIDVVTPGVGAQFRPISQTQIDTFKRENNLERPFILHVGTLQPRKNIPVLIDAFAQLNDPDYDLVLVGGKGWLYDEIFAKVEQLGITDRVRFTGFVAEETLPYFYNAASLFVMPSVYEGFGIPVADAMACGTPVVVADASSLPEVAGDAGLLFDPYDSKVLVERMASVLYNESQAAIMRAAGLIRSENFSWTQSGLKMAQIYRHTIEQA